MSVQTNTNIWMTSNLISFHHIAKKTGQPVGCVFLVIYQEPSCWFEQAFRNDVQSYVILCNLVKKNVRDKILHPLMRGYKKQKKYSEVGMTALYRILNNTRALQVHDYCKLSNMTKRKCQTNFTQFELQCSLFCGTVQ